MLANSTWPSPANCTAAVVTPASVGFVYLDPLLLARKAVPAPDNGLPTGQPLQKRLWRSAGLLRACGTEGCRIADCRRRSEACSNQLEEWSVMECSSWGAGLAKRGAKREPLINRRLSNLICVLGFLS